MAIWIWIQQVVETVVAREDEVVSQAVRRPRAGHQWMRFRKQYPAAPRNLRPTFDKVEKEEEANWNRPAFVAGNKARRLPTETVALKA